MTHNTREEIEEILYAPNLNIPQGEYRTFIDEVAPKIVSTLHHQLQKAREEENEACAVTVWNYLATFEDCLEPTQRTNALNHAIKLIRKRKIDHSELDQDRTTLTQNSNRD